MGNFMSPKDSRPYCIVKLEKILKKKKNNKNNLKKYTKEKIEKY